MDIVRISLIGIITAVCVLSLKDSKSDIAMLLGLTGGVIIMLSLLEYFAHIFDFVNSLIEKSGIDSEIIKLLLKIVGIGYIADFSAGIVEDSGSKALAEKIALGGKVIIMALTLPIIGLLFEIITSLI